MTKKRLIFRYVKMFLLSLLIFITTFLVVVRLTILNSAFVERQYTTSYYKNVEKDLKTKMKDSMISSGIDDKVIDTMFDHSDVKKTSEEALDIIYNYNKQSLDTSKIKAKLEENVRNNLIEKNYVVPEDDGFKNFIDSTMDIYESEFDMLNHISTVGIYMQTVIKVVTVLVIMLVVITALIITVRYRKMPRYLPVALFTTSFLNIFGGFYIYNTAGLGSITVISPTFSEILRKVLSKTFQTFYMVSFVYILLGILLCFFIHQHRHRHHHHHHSH